MLEVSVELGGEKCTFVLGRNNVGTGPSGAP